MSVTMWVPGIGNVTTFDGAIVPPGGRLVSSSPSTSSKTESSGSSTSQPAETYRPSYSSDTSSSSNSTYNSQGQTSSSNSSYSSSSSTSGPGINVQHSLNEIGRAQKAYDEYIKAGRQDLAEASHTYADQLRAELKNNNVDPGLYNPDVDLRHRYTGDAPAGQYDPTKQGQVERTPEVIITPPAKLTNPGSLKDETGTLGVVTRPQPQGSSGIVITPPAKLTNPGPLKDETGTLGMVTAPLPMGGISINPNLDAHLFYIKREWWSARVNLELIKWIVLKRWQIY